MSKENPEVGDIWRNKDNKVVEVFNNSNGVVFIKWAQQIEKQGQYSIEYHKEKVGIKKFMSEFNFVYNSRED